VHGAHQSQTPTRRIRFIPGCSVGGAGIQAKPTMDARHQTAVDFGFVHGTIVSAPSPFFRNRMVGATVFAIMVKHIHPAAAVAALVLGIAIGTTPGAQAQLDKLLKGAAVLAIVDSNSRSIDDFVNKVTQTRNDDPKFATKVVPILTIGGATFAGAAQISGPVELVSQVKAVAQAEGDTRLGARIRIRGLIPVENREVRSIGDLKRVSGVGITATVEIRL